MEAASGALSTCAVDALDLDAAEGAGSIALNGYRRAVVRREPIPVPPLAGGESAFDGGIAESAGERDAIRSEANRAVSDRREREMLDGHGAAAVGEASGLQRVNEAAHLVGARTVRPCHVE